MAGEVKRRRARKKAKGPKVKQAFAVIFTSPNGREPWHALKPEEVPDWVKHPDNMARMLRGEECMKCDEGPAGSNWYRAVLVNDINQATKADH